MDFAEQLAQVRAYGRRPIYIPLCFWSLESNWLDSGLIVLHGVPFVQRIRTTSACEYALDKLKKPERAALVDFWESWQDELANIRLLDPACGSGALLIQAFNQLFAEYQASNDRLKELGVNRPLLDLDKRILQDNLYGVDLNDEAVEICRLSLWIKTAHRGKPLTSLDRTICVGNSIVADPAIDPKAFDWERCFPDVFRDGGFDVVVANPPYVRQELLQSIKPYLESAYRTYHGMADLYVYFYELGLRVLKPGGRLSFIVTNKWMKAGYGEPLRRFFSEYAWIESVVDFGHAKQIFEDADVFPLDSGRTSAHGHAEADHGSAVFHSARAVADRRSQSADRGRRSRLTAGTTRCGRLATRT